MTRENKNMEKEIIGWMNYAIPRGKTVPNFEDLVSEFRQEILTKFIDSEIERKNGMRISQDKAPKNSTESEKQNYDLGYAEALNDDIAHLQAIKDSLK